MNLSTLDQLLQRYRQLGQQHPDDDRIALEIDEKIVGSVAPVHAELIARQVHGVSLDDDTLAILPVCAPDAPAALRVIADELRNAGLAPHWRNEQLPVCADDGTLVGSIERACVRILGIRTFAVHLAGQLHQAENANERDASVHDYTVWLQRRAPDKPVDPNMLDTLAGGLIGMQDGAMEPLRLGLQREVSEEAGLEPDQYDDPAHLETVRMRWQVPEGYFEEDCIIYHATLKPGVQPVNRDGEVAEFMRVGGAQLIELIERGELTETAAVASLLAMRHVLQGTG